MRCWATRATEINRLHASQRGLPVPPAFCITTEVCRRHLADPQRTLDAIWDAVLQAMSWLEAESEHTFGRGPRPLLVSVRSGAVESMPGMLDTVLDLGLNDEVRDALATSFTPAFADDTRTRFDRMYRRVVLGDKGGTVPDDPHAQLRCAVEAVFEFVGLAARRRLPPPSSPRPRPGHGGGGAGDGLRQRGRGHLGNRSLVLPQPDDRRRRPVRRVAARRTR